MPAKKRKKKYPVVIEIRDSHEVDGEVTSSEVMCDGMLMELDDGCSWQLDYTEQSEGLKGSHAALRVQDRLVSLSRQGACPLEITLEQGVRHSCYYNTPAGMMHMGVFARSVESNLTPAGGRIKLAYTLDFYADMMSSNQMEIQVQLLA
ncbi:MAG: DUF1934 domain-containing protein [Oscillospiraceae bacterium]|jgi:uncharacterized beta-barrel protein YwiB (DUF1934 family)|nr:DUF1934 domain-containing protein [Oscillospiraceae bacterium]